jgi:2-polyprenyl-3-methyl-5-hydroxy-6-metoxy-1,4-benzoquinol methylase
MPYNWQPSSQAPNFNTFVHLQCYGWVAPQIQNLSCLDDGCGSGYGTHYLSTNSVKEIMGIDISSESIDYANKTLHQDKQPISTDGFIKIGF